ncbi:sigma D regulator [Pseudoalteromonas ruthenica]|uniref:Sigma D regulator n=1 Tax=Pseudoalteromonas ruthenica TaxID=151081 RepID=A0A5S3Z742_9GAMM|nr:sigma D regulator [Pseudoalteromonas ruthenica]TMP87407.1 sigma D regulator [Pseudoalteromonas ruthenica]
MLSRLEKAQQKWGGSHTVIDKWLAERQELLVQYCNMAGNSHNAKHDKALPEPATIQQFCQLLMDYLSAGHFEIYDDIVKQCESRGPESLELAQSLYPQISATTDVALDFNDSYAEVKGDDLMENFDNDLSTLGEALSTRFELEDELIHNLYTNHT